MLTRRRVIAAKVETTEGTAETLTTAEGGILAIDPKVDPDIKMNARDPVTAALSKMADVPGSRSAKISFKAELKGAGSAYSLTNLPALSPYLRACGFSETVDVTAGAEKVTYKPASSGVPALTIGCYEDGVFKQLIGSRGNVKFSGKTGEITFAEFEFTGVWGGVTDVTLLAPTYEGTVPPTFLSASFTLASYAAIIAGYDIDMANVIALRESANSAAGFLSALITGRDPNGKLDPEMTTVAVYDWYGKWLAGTSGALNIGTIGGTQYNKYKITAPVVLPRKVSDADREGIAIAEMDFQLAMSSGDDELVLEFS